MPCRRRSRRKRHICQHARSFIRSKQPQRGHLPRAASWKRIASPQSAALLLLFFAERQAGKIPGLGKDVALRPIRKVGVLGAGTMGGGIARAFANAGLPTRVVDTSTERRARGLALISKYSTRAHIMRGAA